MQQALQRHDEGDIFLRHSQHSVKRHLLFPSLYDKLVRINNKEYGKDPNDLTGDLQQDRNGLCPIKCCLVIYIDIRAECQCIQNIKDHDRKRPCCQIGQQNSFVLLHSAEYKSCQELMTHCPRLPP